MMQAYKDLDFLEIGTSDFDTLIQKADGTTVGISVEPIKFYLDRLPSPANVEKVNAAISITNTAEDLPLYYIPHQIIKKNKLPKWFRGCNSLGKMHPTIVAHKVEHLAEVLIVPQIPISIFLESRSIRRIEYLKIDTEGNDTFILRFLFEYLKDKPLIFLPRTIKFESNVLSNENDIKEVIELYLRLGYTVKSKKSDTVLCQSLNT